MPLDADGAPVSRLTRLRRRLADRGAEQQLLDAGRAGVERGRPRTSAALAVLLAAGVHLLTSGLVVTGVLVCWQAPVFLKVFGLLPLLLAVAVLPRLRLPDGDVELGREDAPHLFDLVDRVAAHTGAPVPHRVRLDATFDAYAVGTRRRVLGIGVPLWMALPPQARVAVLAHELGHFAHRDLLHGWWVGRATVTLERWIWLVDDRRDEGWAWLEGEGATSQRLLSVVYAPLRLVFSLALQLLVLVNATAGRRQEYLADLDAITAAGTDGAREALHVTLADEAVAAALTRAALGPRRHEPWAVVAETLATTDARGRANRLAQAERRQARADDTHPATSMRLRLVDLRPWAPAAVVVDTGEEARLEAELAPYLEVVGRRVVEAIRYTT